MEAIETSGSVSLSARLGALEHEKRRIETQLDAMRAVKSGNLTEADLRGLVEKNVANLQDVLKADVTLARQVLQRHIKMLSVFPSEFEGNPVFEVIGELDLFTVPSDSDSGVLLGVLGTLNDQQHTTDRYFRFIIRVDVHGHPACPLLEPLCQLLETRPELALEPRTASEWAQLLREFIPDGPGKPKQLGYGAIARCFWFHRAQLENRLTIIKMPHPLNIGHLYRICLRSTTSVGKGNSEDVQSE